MRRKALSILTVLILCAFALNTTVAQDGYELIDLTFQGNQTFSDGDLFEHMEMFTVGWFSHTVLFNDRFSFSSEILEQDVARLIRFYQSEGFLHAKIPTPEVRVYNEDREVGVNITIEEGIPVTIGQPPTFKLISSPNERVAVQNIAFDSTALLQLRKGERFRDNALLADQAFMVNRFVEEGFAYVKVDYALNVDTAANVVNIEWTIDAGPLCVFGDVEIAGTERVSPVIITENLRFDKGQIFSPSLVDASQQEVYALGVFRSVTFQAKMNGRESSEIPVRVQVREAPRFKLKFSVGVGTETGFRSTADLDFLDVFGGARKVNLLAKYSKLEPYNVTATFTQPDIPTNRSSIVLSPFIRRQKEEGFNLRRFGGSISILHQLSPFTNGFATYSFERVDVFESSAPPEQFVGDVNLTAYNKSGISLGATFDDTAPLFSPNSGFYISLAYQISGLGLNSPFLFMKTTVEAHRFQRVTDDVVFATRLKVGSAHTYSGISYIPIEERFFSGGTNSVRGWARQRLGPLDTTDKPVGGRSLMELNNELRYPIIGILSGVVFSDIGNVWATSYTFKLNSLRTSFGVGLRVESPIGPIRFDVARPFFDDETRVQFHLDVGHAF